MQQQLPRVVVASDVLSRVVVNNHVLLERGWDCGIVPNEDDDGG
eukprot:CAMPEP_0118704564 /NCGR_PEP_ID=MMETSP0800-20121206/19310_1 /TAXON_ID=210618 ORGANISM="Striatella unipunctata, Strain CCMP2910" /NCGR_SAMPLE_ID=MMETSP0800 /ASSEMBLY_ACC=CAM_ASM_000638 /LENGTH=43 /DNA_ID= /DNA_START= /DNA_END= /DNA_ORIENTATION=